MEYIFVKSIDCWRAPSPEVVGKTPDSPSVPVDGGTSFIPMEVYREYVDGRIYANGKGGQVCIGVSKEVGEVLGIGYEVAKAKEEEWRELYLRTEGARRDAQAEATRLRLRLNERDEKRKKEFDDIEADRQALWDALQSIKDAPFWVRLRWLFCRVRTEGSK